MEPQQTILVRVQGPDRPGITAELMRVLAAAGAQVQDVEQVVVRHRLSLGVVIAVPEGRDLLKELLLLGWEHGLTIDFEMVEASPTSPAARHVVTLVAADLGPAELAVVAGAIAGGGGNIDRIVRLSRYPVISYELVVSGGDIETIRRELVTVAAARPLDIAVQQYGLARRAARLVVLDVDSTLIQDEVIDLVAARAGCGEAVRAVTERAMAGHLDFATALRERVALLAGTPVAVVDDVACAVRLTPGARTFIRTLRRLGYAVAIVSGGFQQVTDRLAAELGIGHAHANHLEVVDGVLTGRLVGPIVDRARKADLLREIATAERVGLAQTVAVGDGANDVDMLATAGLGIAFNAKQVVRDVADTALSVPYLDAVLFLLGITREEVEAADAGDDLPCPPA